MSMIKEKSLKLNNDGSTMVEVMVGFVLLMILIASMVGIIDLCSDLNMKAVDIMKEQEAFQRDLYKKDHGVSESAEGNSITILSSNGTVLSLYEVDKNGEAAGDTGARISMNKDLKLKCVENKTTGIKVYLMEKDSSEYDPNPDGQN